jgi:hypothetical protein
MNGTRTAAMISVPSRSRTVSLRMTVTSFHYCHDSRSWLQGAERTFRPARPAYALPRCTCARDARVAPKILTTPGTDIAAERFPATVPSRAGLRVGAGIACACMAPPFGRPRKMCAEFNFYVDTSGSRAISGPAPIIETGGHPIDSANARVMTRRVTQYRGKDREEDRTRPPRLKGGDSRLRADVRPGRDAGEPVVALWAARG